MKIKCPKCETNYNIGSDQIPEKGRKVFCHKCSNQFFVRKKQKETFKSLMNDIKDKLDYWDKSISDSNADKDQSGSGDENELETDETRSENSDPEVDDFLNEILDEETPDDSAPPPIAKQKSDDSEHEDIDELIEETISQYPEELLDGITDSVIIEESSASQDNTENATVDEESKSREDTETLSEESVDQLPDNTLEDLSNALEDISDEVELEPLEQEEQEVDSKNTESEDEPEVQDDIDSLLTEATEQQQEEILEDAIETVGDDKEQAEKETEVESSLTEADSIDAGQENIDDLLAESAEQQQEEVLEGAMGTVDNNKEQADREPEVEPSVPEADSTDAGQEDIDALFTEATAQKQEAPLKEETEKNENNEDKAAKEPEAAPSAPEADSTDAGQEDIDALFAQATTQQQDGSLKEETEKNEKNEDKAAKEPEAAPSAPEADSTDAGQEDIDALFAQATAQQQDGSLKEETEKNEKNEDKAAKEPEAAPSAPEADSTDAGQEDIDALFAQATTQQQDGSLKEETEKNEKNEDKAAKEPEAAPSAPEADSTDAGQEDIDALFAQATAQQQDGSLKNPPEAETESSPPTDKTASAGDEAVGQEDLDKLFAEAVAQQQDGTLENRDDSGAEEKTAAPANTGAEEQGNDDIDKLFAEAVEQQQDGSLEDSPEDSATDQGNIDELWASALEESSSPKEPDSEEASAEPESAPEEAKKDVPDAPAADTGEYSVDSADFQDDLANLLEDAKAEESAPAKEEEAQTSELEEITAVEGDTPTTELEEIDVLEDEEETEDDDDLEEKGSKKGSLKEKAKLYKDLVVFFVTDKNKILKVIIPAFILLSGLSGGGYWYYNKLENEKMLLARIDAMVPETIEKIETPSEKSDQTKIEPAPPEEKETTAPESNDKKMGEDKQLADKKANSKTEKKEPGEKVIPGAGLPETKGKDMTISIGSIVPVAFNPDEIKVMSANIKLIIDNPKVYEQVQKGFPVFEESVENAIEKYFEGKFYKNISFVQEKLRKEVLAKVNQKIVGGQLKTVELEDFLIQ